VERATPIGPIDVACPSLTYSPPTQLAAINPSACAVPIAPTRSPFRSDAQAPSPNDVAAGVRPPLPPNLNVIPRPHPHNAATAPPVANGLPGAGAVGAPGVVTVSPGPRTPGPPMTVLGGGVAVGGTPVMSPLPGPPQDADNAAVSAAVRLTAGAWLPLADG